MEIRTPPSPPPSLHAIPPYLAPPLPSLGRILLVLHLLLLLLASTSNEVVLSPPRSSSCSSSSCSCSLPNCGMVPCGHRLSFFFTLSTSPVRMMFE